MPALARGDLEALLRTRKLDRTLTSTWPVPDPHDDRLVAPTGLRALDDRLGGGLPRGHLSELVGSPSSGRTSLLCAAMGAATARGEIVAYVDTFDALDPASAAAAGVDLSRLLWIRGQACSPGANTPGRPTSTPSDRAVDRALKAVNLVLQAGGFGLVALDLIDAPVSVLRRLPFTTWMRLQRILEGRETVCVVLADAPLARSAGGVTIALRDRHEAKVVGSRQYARGKSDETIVWRANTNVLESVADVDRVIHGMSESLGAAY